MIGYIVLMCYYIYYIKFYMTSKLQCPPQRQKGQSFIFCTRHSRGLLSTFIVGVQISRVQISATIPIPQSKLLFGCIVPWHNLFPSKTICTETNTNGVVQLDSITKLLFKLKVYNISILPISLQSSTACDTAYRTADKRTTWSWAEPVRNIISQTYTLR